MKIFAILQEPANYTLDLIKNVYEARGVRYGFINGASTASDASVINCIRGKDLLQILRDNDAFVINGYTGRICLLAIWLNIFFFKKPMALESDTELRIPFGRLRRIVKWLWLHFLFTRRYCYGFAGGNYGHKELFRYYGMPEERIFLAPMMVDNDKYIRNAPTAPHSPFRFAYLGRLVAHKQVDKIIAALPDAAELHIVGDGPERACLERAVGGKSVVFHGTVFGADKTRLLHSIDCLVLYSSYEPWGLVVNEALASGIPVIVSDKVGARKDLVEAGNQTGLVAKWDDVNDLVNKMSLMSSDATLWARLRDSALRRMACWNYALYGRQFDSWTTAICKRQDGELQSARNEKRFNLGAALLKIIMCFGVVGCHFGKSLGGGVEVPLFALMAFALSAIPDDRNTLFARLRRLALPFWFWGVLGFFIWPLTTEKEVTLRNLIARLIGQLTLGSSLNSPLYFIFIVIVLTCLLYMLAKYRAKSLLLLGMLVMAFVFQYSGYNYAICECLPMGSNNVIGRISELLPYAVAGVLIYIWRDILFIRHRAWVIFASVFLLLTLIWQWHGLETPPGFGYQGVGRFFLCVGLFVFAYGIGSYHPVSKNFWLVKISAFTPGIYYSHRLVGDVLLRLLPLDNWLIRMNLVAMLSGILIFAMRKYKPLQLFVS